MRNRDSRRIPLILSLSVGVLVACEETREEGSLVEEPAIEEETGADEAVLATWEASLSPVTMNSTMTGSATLQATADGGTEVVIWVESSDPSHAYPWHVHTGTCGSNGPIVGDASAYEAITTDESGAGESRGAVPSSLDPEADYHVNVHASPDLLEQIVACGEVESR